MKGLSLMFETKKCNCEMDTTGVGARVRFDTIQGSGTYVCNYTGHLFRLPEDVFSTSGPPFFNIVSREPLFLTKISNDPFVSISAARVLACNMNVQVNF